MSREEACRHAHRSEETALGRTNVVVDRLSVALFVVAIATPVVAGPVCTLVMEPRGSAPVIGDKCETRVSPSSTFDIALSLMGFDSGLLTAPDSATWPNRRQPCNVEDGRAPRLPNVASQFGRAVFAGAGEGSWLGAAATVRRQHQFR